MAEEILYQYKHGNATIIVMKPEITDPEETERRRQATRELAGRLYWEQVHENRRRAAEMAAQAQFQPTGRPKAGSGPEGMGGQGTSAVRGGGGDPV